MIIKVKDVNENILYEGNADDNIGFIYITADNNDISLIKEGKASRVASNVTEIKMFRLHGSPKHGEDKEGEE